MSLNLLLSLPLSICLPISVSLSCIQICLSFLLSVRLCIFTQSPPHLYLFHQIFFCVCVMFLSDCPSFCLFLSNPHSLRQGLPEHSKPLARCQTFVWVFFVPKHILGRKKYIQSNYILCFRKNYRIFFFYVCKNKAFLHLGIWRLQHICNQEFSKICFSINIESWI